MGEVGVMKFLNKYTLNSLGEKKNKHALKSFWERIVGPKSHIYLI